VSTEHILLGLIAESPTFYSSCGISPGLAKEAVVSLTGRKAPLGSNDTIVFSRSVRRTFEAATNVRSRGSDGEGAWGSPPDQAGNNI
jgi:hypothetical protein